jgi:hypothetical protein
MALQLVARVAGKRVVDPITMNARTTLPRLTTTSRIVLIHIHTELRRCGHRIFTWPYTVRNAQPQRHRFAFFATGDSM